MRHLCNENSKRDTPRHSQNRNKVEENTRHATFPFLLSLRQNPDFGYLSLYFPRKRKVFLHAERATLEHATDFLPTLHATQSLSILRWIGRDFLLASFPVSRACAHAASPNFTVNRNVSETISYNRICGYPSEGRGFGQSKWIRRSWDFFRNEYYHVKWKWSRGILVVL